MQTTIKPDERARLRKIFISLVAADLAWSYVDKILRYCADHKLSAYQKRSRAVRALRDEYNAFLDRNFNPKHKEIVRWAILDFGDNFSYELTVMSCTLANEMYHTHNGKPIDHDSMRIDALCCVTLLRALFSMRDAVYLPTLHELEKLIAGYYAPYDLDLTRNVELCRKTMAARLESVPEMEVTER